MRMASSVEIIWKDPALKRKCLNEGKQSERTPGIVVYKLQHSQGLILLYANTTSDKTLHEEMQLNIEGLVIEE